MSKRTNKTTKRKGAIVRIKNKNTVNVHIHKARRTQRAPRVPKTTSTSIIPSLPNPFGFQPRLPLNHPFFNAPMSNAPPAPLQTPVHVTINNPPLTTNTPTPSTLIPPAPSTPVSAPSPVFQPASPSTTPLVSTGIPPLKKGPPTQTPMKPNNLFGVLYQEEEKEQPEHKTQSSNENIDTIAQDSGVNSDKVK